MAACAAMKASQRDRLQKSCSDWGSSQSWGCAARTVAGKLSWSNCAHPSASLPRSWRWSGGRRRDGEWDFNEALTWLSATSPSLYSSCDTLIGLPVFQFSRCLSAGAASWSYCPRSGRKDYGAPRCPPAAASLARFPRFVASVLAC